MELFIKCLLLSSLPFLLSAATTPTSNRPTLDIERMRNHLAAGFVKRRDDFAPSQPNGVYFPLENAQRVSAEISRPNAEADYDVVKNRTDSFVKDYRGLQPVTSEERATMVNSFMNSLSEQNATADVYSWNSLLEQELTKEILSMLPASWRSLLVDQVVATVDRPLDWTELVNQQPTNVAFLMKVAQSIREQRKVNVQVVDQAEDMMAKGLKLPAEMVPELAYILAYRWKVDELRPNSTGQQYSMETLVNLPVDSVLNINNEYFNTMGLKDKLKKGTAFSKLNEGSLVAWFSTAEKLLGAKTLTNEFADYAHLVLSAPLQKMSSMIQNLPVDAKIFVLKTFNLNPVRVQEIWKQLADVPESRNQLSELFFKIGPKLDIDQLDVFYKLDYAHLYSSRHELETFWVVQEGVVPWASLKYVGNQHRSSKEPAAWEFKDLLNLGKFAVTLSASDLKDIKDTALSPSTAELIISSKMTNGQLCILYKKIFSKMTSKLPVDFYPCLGSSILAQTSSTQVNTVNPVNPEGMKQLIMASKRFVPAQISALVHTLTPSLWTKEVLSLVLLYNPALLAATPSATFKLYLADVRAAVVHAGAENYWTVVQNIKKLPRRLLTAWLEKAVPLTTLGMLDTDVLLDRPAGLRSIAAGRSNLSGDLYSQAVNATRQGPTKGTFLPSLALTGLSCEMIQKIPVGDIVEVISVYRFQIDKEVIPSNVRKCFARALRKYLALKAELYGVKAEAEVELLSMLDTADIRAVGAEIFLTWGGAVLTEITHPQVMFEVLEVIAESAPHIFLHNGVSLQDVKLMARVLYKTLLHNNKDVVDIKVLKRLRDLLPFVDIAIDATPEQIRQFFTTVHEIEGLSKGICVPANNRNLIRSMIIKGFGGPQTWTALDLLFLGDFLITMRQEDLMKVPVGSLVRALPQLVSNSLYGTKLPEVRGFIEPQLYSETCAMWLNNGNSSESGEGKEFISAWRTLANWHLYGSSLTNSRNNQATLASHRRRRQTLGQAPEVNYRILHDKVMNETLARFQTLPKDVTDRVLDIILETQELLGNGSLVVLGLDPTKVNYAQKDVLQIISQAKSSNKLSTEQEQAIVNLSVDAQVRLIQKLVALLKLDAATLGVSATTLSNINSLKTFVQTEEYVATAKYEFATTTTSTIAGRVGSTTTTKSNIFEELLTDDKGSEELLQEFLDDTTTTTTTTTTAPRTSSTTSKSVPAPVTSGTTTKSSTTTRGSASGPIVAPVTTSAPIVASTEPVLPSKMTCNDLRSAGLSASMVRVEDLSKMEKEDVEDCLEVIGELNFLPSDLPDIWSALRDVIKPAEKFSGIEMMNLHNLLPEVARVNPELLDLTSENLDAISVLGSLSPLLIQNFFEVNTKETLTEFELVALGHMVCGMSEEQWNTVADKQTLVKLMVPVISSLNCEVDQKVTSKIRELVILDLDMSKLTSSEMMELGWLVGTLTKEQLATVSPTLMNHVSGSAIRKLDLDDLSVDQLLNLSPHAASIAQNFGSYLNVPQRRAIRAAVGEDPSQLKKFSAVELHMEELDIKRAEEERLEAERQKEKDKMNLQGGASPLDGEAPTDGAGTGAHISLYMFLVLCLLHYF